MIPAPEARARRALKLPEAGELSDVQRRQVQCYADGLRAVGIKNRPQRARKAAPLTTPLVHVVRLELALPPSLTNSGAGRSRHWRAVERERTTYLTDCHARQIAKMLPPAPDHPWSGARLTSTLYLGAAMDDDGAMARLKWPIDALVQLGYLAGDSRTHLRIAVPEQVVARNQAYRVEITLEPLEG